MNDLVSFERGALATITLRRPEQRNALSSRMLEQIHEAMDAAAADETTRCVLLQGEGKHFCAGADFGDVAAGAEEGVRYGAGFEALLRDIEEHPVPFVAKVQGAALGAGCQLLLACDLAVAAADARIGIPSARLGLLLDLEKIERLARVVGIPTAREMLLSGREWSGREAAERRIVTRAVASESLDDETRDLAERVAACAPLSVRGSKAALRTILDHGGLDRSRDAEVFADHDRRSLEALTSEDLREGVAALRERRPPAFRGR